MNTFDPMRPVTKPGHSAQAGGARREAALNEEERMGSPFPAVAATVPNSGSTRIIRRGLPPVRGGGGDTSETRNTYTVKALWDETGKTEVLAVSREEGIARQLAREHSRKNWFSAVYVTNGSPGIRSAFKMGRAL